MGTDLQLDKEAQLIVEVTIAKADDTATWTFGEDDSVLGNILIYSTANTNVYKPLK